MRRERRREAREEVSWVGRYRFDDQPSWGWCHVVDISLHGAGVELRGSVPKDCVGQRILVRVEEPALLRFVGECRHSDRSRTGRTRIGVELSVVPVPEDGDGDLVGSRWAAT